jgi:hypothetical protein
MMSRSEGVLDGRVVAFGEVDEDHHVTLYR